VFACSTARRRRLTVSGLDLHLLTWGDGGRPALCFLHGGSAHAHWFDAVVTAFADRYHVVALDQRGHGESQWARPPAYATEDFAADLAGVLDGLGVRRAVVVGHSMGGHNAMGFAAWYPARVRALVVVDARPAIPAERLDRLRRRGAFALRPYRSLDEVVASFRLVPRETVADPKLLAHLASVGVVERDGGFSYRFDPDCNRLRRPADLLPVLPRITAPTLIVRAALSPVLPLDLATRMRDAIPGTRLVEIPDAYHHLVLDAPSAFADVLDHFLASLPA
jgi:pimeloyl-ACP methyl ester carboxylesterase